MEYLYDLHIHSALSPCADDDMSPLNIVAKASAIGLNFIAITDHNSIKNVEVAMSYGKLLDVIVIPGVEIQTNEDIHIVCFFKTYADLKNFMSNIQFTDRINDKNIFGNQLIFDENDEVVGEEKCLLSTGALISEEEVRVLANSFGGVAIPAHVDRDENAIIAILGNIPNAYSTVEFSRDKKHATVSEYLERYNIIFDTDAHSLEQIGQHPCSINLENYSAEMLINLLREKPKKA